MNDTAKGICIAPFVIYAVMALGLLSQLSIFVLFFWVILGARRVKRMSRDQVIKGHFDCRSTSNLSDGCYSSYASTIGQESISSKTSLYSSGYFGRDSRGIGSKCGHKYGRSTSSIVLSVSAKALGLLILIGVVVLATADDTVSLPNTTTELVATEAVSFEPVPSTPADLPPPQIAPLLATAPRKLDSNCPTDRVHFELHSGHLGSSGQPPYHTTRDLQPDECLQACREELNCRSLNIDYRRGVCEFYATSGLGHGLKKSPAHNVFEKICLGSRKTALKCARRDFAYERVLGKELVGLNTEKVLITANSTESCLALCVEFDQFECRSAEFRPKKNQCRLSSYNRFSTNDDRLKLETSKSGLDSVEYLENNCADGES